tara:strand:- start:222 stop:554 length:333 start_codon:yes stop_codon:yes gene_type:complete
MKKLFTIIVLGLLWSGNAYSLTLYCDTSEWKNFMTLRVDMKSKTIQDDLKMGGGKIYRADINDKTITFRRTDELWVISRVSGKFTRKVYNPVFEQSGECSTSKPSYKKKF